MECVTRYPKKPKLKFLREVRVSHIHRDRPLFLELLARAATGRTPLWLLHSLLRQKGNKPRNGVLPRRHREAKKYPQGEGEVCAVTPHRPLCTEYPHRSPAEWTATIWRRPLVRMLHSIRSPSAQWSHGSLAVCDARAKVSARRALERPVHTCGPPRGRNETAAATAVRRPKASSERDAARSVNVGDCELQVADVPYEIGDKTWVKVSHCTVGCLLWQKPQLSAAGTRFHFFGAVQSRRCPPGVALKEWRRRRRP